MKSLGLTALASLLSVLLAAPAFCQEDRKEKQSEFKIRDLNKFMLAAVDNSSNNVKNAAPPGDYRVYGKVVDHEGEPIVGAKILLAEDRRGMYLYHVNFDVTDDQGRFVVVGAPSSHWVYVQAGSTFCKIDTGGKEDVVVRVPRARIVRFVAPKDIKLFDDAVWVRARGTRTGETITFGNLNTRIGDSKAGKFRLAPGRYLVNGYRKIKTSDKPKRGTVEFGEIEVDDRDDQTFDLGAREGQSVSGTIADFGEIAKRTDILGVEASLVLVRTQDQSEWRTMDTTVVKEDGSFRFHNVPEGTYVLSVNTIPKPQSGGGRSFGFATPIRNTKLFKERIEVGDSEVSIALPIKREANSIVDQIHRILDSEHPTPNVSWSWTDVQVQQLRSLPDREATTTELLRLLEADDTPSNWRYLVIHSLWRIRPISEKTKDALVAALSDPVNRSRRGSILSTLRNMGSDAIPMVDVIISMKDDDTWGVRYGVADAMGQIGRTMIDPPPKMVDTAIALLDDPHGMVRKQAAGSLGILHSPRAVDALRRRIDDPYGPARAMAAWALLESSGEAEPALSAMLDLLENGDHDAKKEAAYYLQMFDHRAAAAIEPLKANATYAKKPPFTSPRETIQYQLRQAAERAIAIIEQGQAWNADPDRFELTVDPITDASQLGDAAFGTASKGLELGIVVDSEQTEFVTGERVPIALLVRNTTENPIRFELDRRLSDIPLDVTAGTSRGPRPTHYRLLVRGDFLDVTVPGGAVFRISHPGLGLGVNPRPGQTLWLPYMESVSPGDYQLSQRYRFEVYDEERGVIERMWLTSGKVDLRIR